MTRHEAIEKASAWWFKMIRDGVWDNGDAHTEGMRKMFLGSISYQPTEEDFAKLKPGLVRMMDEFASLQEAKSLQYGVKDFRATLYADYGCGELDDLYKRLGLQMTSRFHCPQKAGTVITRTGDDYTVEAKEGYGAAWAKI